MMNIVSTIEKKDLARVFIADCGRGRTVEFVESVQPPIPRREKWVLIISTSAGCPVQCLMCDAGGSFHGQLGTAELLAQIDHLVLQRYPDRVVPAKKFKVQFARMGEPAFNPAVLEVLRVLKERYQAPGLMPCISTIAPQGRDGFFEELLRIKQALYDSGRFQLQFSLHSTDEPTRDRLMPVRKWSLHDIAGFGERFVERQDRKVTLNFALTRDAVLDADVMSRIFSPDTFMIKITPVNPTHQALRHKLGSHVAAEEPDRQYAVCDRLVSRGFQTLISIGENEENLVGSNCGQYVTFHMRSQQSIENSYSYARRISVS
jgi:23S rRNA (adenine2503-C2)-methyltransferase